MACDDGDEDASQGALKIAANPGSEGFSLTGVIGNLATLTF